MGKVKRFPARAPAAKARPKPPALQWPTLIVPAPELRAWIHATFIEESAPLANPEHKHLLEADFEVMWAQHGFEKQGRYVVGQAEEVAFRAGGWQKQRQEQQFDEWFGRTPKYLLTFAAGYAESCSDAEWCAVVEHELYHLGHKRDEFGAPAFTKDGQPKLFIRGHDFEEFVGVVERYGAGPSEGALARAVRAANRPPELSEALLRHVCGTCTRETA